MTSLSDLSSKASDLPIELHSIIEMTTAQLNGHVSEADKSILSHDVASFLDNIHAISDALTVQLSVLASHLCHIADPSSPPSVDRLPIMASNLRNSATQHQPQELYDARLQLASTTSTVLSLHRTLLETSIRILEQTQHGALARHTKASADLQHMRASVLGLQAQIHTLTHAPPPELVAALNEFKKLQGSGEKALRDREGLARRKLELYEKAGEKGMRDLARRKEGLGREIERMEREIGKLEGRH